MVVDFGLGKKVTAAARAFEKCNQQPAIRHNKGQKDRLCSGYLFGGYGMLLQDSVSHLALNRSLK